MNKMINEVLTGHLCYDNQKEYQFIFSTLQWFSFYCVYIKLNSEGGDYLTSIDFHIETYKGPKRGFKNSDIEKFEFDKTKEGVLRIGAKITTNGNDNINHKIDISKHKIKKDNLKAIFFTRDKNYYDDLNNLSSEGLIGLTKKVEEFGSLETETYNNLIENLLNFSKKYSKSRKKKVKAMAVGRNCRISYIKVKYP